MAKYVIEIPKDHKRVIDNLVEDGKGYLLPSEVENRLAIATRNATPLEEVLEDIKAEIEQVKAIMNEEIIEHNRKDLINFVNGINQCLCIIDKHISGKEQQMTEQERKNYCKDCDRSIWGDKSCDINVDDNGYYNRPDICLCKIVNGKRAELHSWEKDKYISGKEK